jgi:hypothetical protein
MDAVAELLIKHACAEVVTRYAIAVNDWNLDAFVGLFVEDGEWHRPGNHSMFGRAAMRAYLQSQPQPPAERTVRHVNGGILVDVVDADHASVWSQTTVYDTGPVADYPAPMKGPDLIVEYRDEMVRHEGRWMIRRRNTTVVFKAG